MSPPSAADSHPATSLADRTASGVIWGAGGAIVYQLFALFVQTALTYLLSKAQYGSYGKAFAVLGFAMLVQQVGFNEVLLRRRARLRLWASPAFWCALTLGLSGSVVLVVLALPLGLLYADPELGTLILLMSPTPLIRSLLVLPAAQLVEAMRFRLHYGLMLVNALLISSATLAFACLGLGAKSFVAATLLVDPLYVIVMWRVAGSQVRDRPRPARWLPLARHLRFIFGSNVARWIRASTDPLIFGLFATSSAVGVYFYAQSMAVQVIRVVTLNLSGVLLPALNRLTNDPQRQTAAFLRAARVLTLIGAPMCVGLAAVGPLFVRVFLDAHKWAALPPVLGMLCIGMAFRLADEPIQSLISAQGRFRLGFRLSLGTGLLYVVVCSLGSIRGNPLVLAVAAACYYALIGPTILFVAIRAGAGRFVDALRVFCTPFLLAIAGIAPWTLLDPWVPGQGRARDCLVLTAVIAASASSYLLLGRTLRPSGWHELLEQVHSRVPARLKPFVAWIGGTPPSTVQPNGVTRGIW